MKSRSDLVKAITRTRELIKATTQDIGELYLEYLETHTEPLLETARQKAVFVGQLKSRVAELEGAFLTADH
ncbi:MAG: hypothetical protein ACO1HP_12925 [Bacteroidota bacterium]